MVRTKFMWAICLMAATAATVAHGADPVGPQPIFYVPFEGSADAVIARGEPKLIGGTPKFEKGVVGQAGATSGRYYPMWEGRGNVCLDRGTFALFYKPNHEVVRQVWGGVAGVGTDIEGYWGLLQRFSMIDDLFCVELIDIGRSGERLPMEQNVGRWKQGEWVHLAVVWDRNEGVIAYEGGKQINSSWGRQRWDWNLDPMTLWVGGEASVDELCVFADCLTDAQIAQLARGEKPTGPPVPMSTPDARRAADVARMGWTDEDLKQLPELTADAALGWTFARMVRATDEKRLVAQPFEGLKATCWPISKYGVSLGRKQRRLDLTFAPDQNYDRVRIFAQRPFTGRLVREVPDLGFQTIAEVDAQRPIWHRALGQSLRYEEISLLREAGWIGEIDCYRVEPLGAVPSANELLPLGDLARLEKMPATPAGKAALSDTPTRFDNPVRATPGGAEPWRLAAPEFGGFQMISQPLAEQRAADGVLIQLVAEEMTGPTPMRIVVKEPIFTQRDWLIADTVLIPKGTGRQKFTLRLRGRPVLNTKGIELPVLVTAGKPITWAMGRDGTTVSLCLADADKSRPVAIEDQVEFAREGYAETNEGHYTIWNGDPATWQRFYTPLKWLADYAPDNRPYMQMAYRVGWRREPLPFVDPVNDTGAPEWAFWQMQAVGRCRAVLDWMIDHRQAENGEFGGLWGDDTDMVENWVGWAMSCDSDRAKIAGALRKFWDGVYRESLVRGVSATIRDNLHSYEEGIGCIAHQLLLDYGDPIAYERVMQSSSHLAQWMKANDDGTLSFRSWMLGEPGVWDYGNFAADTTGNQLMLIPAAYLCWYNRHPEAERYITKWKLTDKLTAGIVGDAYARTLDEAGRRKWYDARLAEESAGRYVPTLNSLLVETGVPTELRDPLLKKGLANQKGELMNSYNMESYGWSSMVVAENQWLAYLASGDTKHLANSYREIAMFINSEDWIYTFAQPSTDRIPLPEASIIRARMGAAPAHRGGNANWWPRHGISYTRGAGQVAALVTENTTRQLAVRLFAFTNEAHPLSVRFWQLDPGTYEMTLSFDKNNDGNAEETIESRTLEIVRGTPVDLKLPPKAGVVLSLKAVKAAAANYDKPDPALTLKTIRLDYGEHLQAKIHNIGRRPVDNLLVRLVDGRSGRVIGERRVKHIDGATDFEPKTAMIEYQNVNSIAHGSIILELDPQHEIDDLNRFNNRVVFEY